MDVSLKRILTWFFFTILVRILNCMGLQNFNFHGLTRILLRFFMILRILQTIGLLNSIQIIGLRLGKPPAFQPFFFLVLLSFFCWIVFVFYSNFGCALSRSLQEEHYRADRTCVKINIRWIINIMWWNRRSCTASWFTTYLRNYYYLKKLKFDEVETIFEKLLHSIVKRSFYLLILDSGY